MLIIARTEPSVDLEPTNLPAGPQPATPEPQAHWQQILAQSIRDAHVLCQRLQLPAIDTAHIQAASRDFPLLVPEPFLQRMHVGRLDDPLLLQVLPQIQEINTQPQMQLDPLQEREYTPVAGIIHKYRGRVLLITQGACAINCRYCFRRHFPYQEHTLSRAQWQASLQYIEERPDIHEVILSGGDPLATSDARLAYLTQAIAKIPHVKRLRIHTRLPVVIPQRIDAACLAWLADLPIQVVMVLHINHAQEIDAQVQAAVARLRALGVSLLNQSVLLAGINDSLQAQIDLSEALFACGILPYYLHTLDPVQGAAHFDYPDEQAQILVSELLAHLPGFLVPRLVREIPERASKTPLVLTSPSLSECT
ncbi:EF-P beta-lysylation protein EpmB [Allopseudospirillum japonicum]|uniref:L-lysine 2,3-aminomutase n=1 Tax=Allopseudospirillum japonicum TaxID=64971 RepID=A0A1H6RGQ7_9GAMM|nr:EF-P beta-lysylation protein EpmB [Allopseudospirillum japonicum]SEI54999.1 EF-P beta-lysylation protein EpmB [Allopseudospirillum japonicum]